MQPAEVFEDAVVRVARQGRQAAVGPEALTALRQPKAVLVAALPVRTDAGTREWSASQEG